MARTLDVFETSAGTKVKKVEASDGRVMRFADGTPIDSRQYGSYKSHKTDTEKFQRGNLGEVETVSELGFPYDQSGTTNTEAFPKGSDGRERSRQRNAWLGFYQTEDTPDDKMEAARQYSQMVSELKDANTEDEEDEIRQQYNIGGS